MQTKPNTPGTSKGTRVECDYADAIPPRTFLLSSKPIGLGQPWAESPSSYFTRVAVRNGFTPLQLINGTNSAPLTRTFPALKPLQHSGRGCFHRRAVATSAAGQQFIVAMADLVGRPELTRLHLSTSFPDFSLARMTRDCDAWCADCLRADPEPHGRLLWEIRLVTECPVHHRRLETSCPSCHRTVRWAAASDIVHCRHCGFDRRDASPSREETSVDVSLAAQFGELVARATDPGGTFQCSASECVSALREFARRKGHVGPSAEAAWLGLDKVSLWNWQRGKKNPSISRIMESALRLGLPVVDVLRGHVPEDFVTSTLSRPREVAKQWSCVRLDPEQRAGLVRRLSEFAQKFPAMGPLRAADRLGIERKTLNRIAPKICAAMSASRKQTLTRRRTEEFTLFKREVDRYVSESVSAGERPAWPGLMRQLTKPGILRNPIYGQYAKKALRTAA